MTLQMLTKIIRKDVKLRIKNKRADPYLLMIL